MRTLDCMLDCGAVAEFVVEREVAGSLRPKRRRAGASASSASVTAGRTSYSTATFSAASRAAMSVSATTIATASPTWRTCRPRAQLQLVQDFPRRRGREARDADIHRIGRVGKMRHADVTVGDVIGAREHRQHAAVSARAGGIDRDDAGVRMRSAHEYRECLLLNRQVVGVAAGAAHETQILEPRQRTADEWTALGTIRDNVVGVHSAPLMSSGTRRQRSGSEPSDATIPTSDT
jgi:hypothetical protein